MSVYNTPLAYFMSFRTYGTWLHGDERASVDRVHNDYESPMLPRSEALTRWESTQLKQAPVSFEPAHREIVDRTIREVCRYKGWSVLALNVRTNHIHVVVDAPGPPEPVMNAFKAWATRRLVEAGLAAKGSRVWSRHGSTVYLFKPEKVEEKCRYVLECQ